MQTQISNTKRHIIKLQKSIDNKLFDLLVDLDDQLVNGYERTEINIMLKANIIRKILVDTNIIHHVNCGNTTTIQEIIIMKSKDNSIYIESVINYDKQIQDNKTTVTQIPLYKNPKLKELAIVKKYKIDMIPIYKYLKTKTSSVNLNTQINYSQNNFVEENKVKKFNDLLLKKKSFQFSYINIKNKQLINHQNDIKNKPKYKNFRESLNDYCPINNINNSSESEDEYKQIKNEYINIPFIINKNNDIEDIRLNESQMQNQINKIPLIGKRSVNHRDIDRKKYLIKYEQDVD